LIADISFEMSWLEDLWATEFMSTSNGKRKFP
jgi:hypothetical protein